MPRAVIRLRQAWRWGRSLSQDICLLPLPRWRRADQRSEPFVRRCRPAHRGARSAPGDFSRPEAKTSSASATSSPWPTTTCRLTVTAPAEPAALGRASWRAAPGAGADLKEYPALPWRRGEPWRWTSGSRILAPARCSVLSTGWPSIPRLRVGIGRAPFVPAVEAIGRARTCRYRADRLRPGRTSLAEARLPAPRREPRAGGRHGLRWPGAIPVRRFELEA